MDIHAQSNPCANKLYSVIHPTSQIAGAYVEFSHSGSCTYSPLQQIIGDTTDPKAATTAQFQEFWTELASRFVSNPKVVFGINNEPHDMVGLSSRSKFQV